MDNHQGPQAPGRLHYASITDVRQAACLMVLGFPLEEKGIVRVYDEEHPKKSTGGIAHFQFKPNDQMSKLIEAYEKGEANIELDKFLESAFHDGKMSLEELDHLLRPAIMAWMRQAIDSYHNIIWFLNHQATELVVTGGEPAHDDDGNVIGKQGFKVKVVKKGKAP